jgi:hypothetical protein
MSMYVTITNAIAHTQATGNDQPIDVCGGAALQLLM